MDELNGLMGTILTIVIVWDVFVRDRSRLVGWAKKRWRQ